MAAKGVQGQGQRSEVGVEVSLGEVIRRLDEIVRAQEKLLDEIKEDRKRNDMNFVRKDVHNEQVAGIKADIDDIDERLDKQDAFRKQIITGVTVGAIMLLINLFIAVNNFISARGG